MDIKKIRGKTEELKALFIIAQRVIPFMEELFVFIDETSPLLEDINNAIKENMKKMPNATKQLTKVTQATELASTEIMDTVDRVNNGLFCVIDELENCKKNQELLLENPISLLRGVAEGIATGQDLKPFLTDINQFIERAESVANQEHFEIISDIIQDVRNISDDANSIINSLQVQDITAQQLAAVNHLLENVQSRLGSIMRFLNEPEATSVKKEVSEDIKISKLHRNIAFDPEAIEAMNGSTNRQDMIDSMIANPDSIDGYADENITSESSSDNVDDIINSYQNQSKLDELSSDEEFSQDDIDALFG